MLDVDYQLIDTEEKRNKIIQKLLTKEILSIDTETTGTEPMEAELVGMSFSDAENRAYYVPVPANRDEALKIVNEFRPLYENENSMKVGQNIKYDMIVLQNYGVQVKGKLFDTMLAHYVLQPELRHNMDYLAEIYLHYQTIHIDELIGAKGKNQKNMRDLPPEDVYRYACEDADVTLKLKNVLEKELKEHAAEHLFYEIEMPARTGARQHRKQRSAYRYRKRLNNRPSISRSACRRLKKKSMHWQVAKPSISAHPSR